MPRPRKQDFALPGLRWTGLAAVVLLAAALALTLNGLATAQDDPDTTAATPPGTFRGTADAELLARYHPDFPNVCRIQARETLLAVGQDAQRNLLLVFAGGAGCEGSVWLPTDAAVTWETDNDDNRIAPPDVESVPPREAVTEVSDYDALCAAVANREAPASELTAGEVQALYMPGSFSWLPPRFVATAPADPDALICLERGFESLGICAGLNLRVERFRERTVVSLVEYSTGGLITQQVFNGPFPADCPSATEREATIYGAPVPRETWAAWLIGRLRLVEGETLRTRTLVPRLNARAASNTRAEIIDILPAGTPVNILARNSDASWYLVLLPDMRRAWLFADFVEVAAQTPLESLPPVSGPAAEIEVWQG